MALEQLQQSFATVEVASKLAAEKCLLPSCCFEIDPHVHVMCSARGSLIGASVSEPLPSDVNVDFVCLSVMDRPAYGVATAHAFHFFHVAVYVTMVTLFRQSIDNTVLISEVLRKPSSK